MFAAVKSQTTAVSYFFNWVFNPFCDRYLWTVPNSNGFFSVSGKEVFSLLFRLCFGFERTVFVCLESSLFHYFISSGKEQECLMNEPRRLCNFKFLPAACGMVSQWVELYFFLGTFVSWQLPPHQGLSDFRDIPLKILDNANLPPFKVSKS